MRNLSVALTFALSVASVSSALAERPEVMDGTVPERDVALQHGIGGGAGTDFPALNMDMAVLYRWRFLSVGGSGQMGSALDDTYGGYWSGAGHAGYGLRTEYLRFDLLGTFGLHQYHAIGSNRIDDAGARETLAYAGGQTRLFFVFKPERPRHLLLGLVGQLDSDLQPVTRRSRGTDFWTGEATSHAHRIGGTRGSVLLALGMLFDAH